MIFSQKGVLVFSISDFNALALEFLQALLNHNIIFS